MKQMIILAAGQSKRMKSKLSKVMHPLGGRRVLDYVLELAASFSPQRTVLVTSPDLQELSFEGVETVVQSPAKGTGDAVRYALPYVEKKGSVVVLFGDTPLIRRETLNRMFEEAERDRPAITVLGMRCQNPQGYGRLVADEAGHLIRIVEEKDCTDTERQITLCNSGVMLIDGALLEGFLHKLSSNNASGEYYLTDCVEVARSQGLTCRVVEGEATEFLGINTRHDLATAEAVLQNRLRDEAMKNGVTLMDPATTYFSYDTKIARDVTIHPHVTLGVGVDIHEDAIIYPYTMMEDTVVGMGAKVGPFARLRGHVVLGEKVEIGNFVEVKKSTFGAKAKAKHLSYVGDATIGERSNIGAGTITCNYDGFLKSSTIIGEDVLVGSNTSLIAPVSIGDGAIVGAGSVVTKNTPAYAMTVERSEQRILEGAGAVYREKKLNMKMKRA